MLPCLRRVLRPAFSLTAGRGLTRAGHRSSGPSAVVSGSPGRLASQPPLSALVQRCYLGTHPLKEPVEPLNSPRGAKDFIYSLHPSERSCLLRELHKFESIAIAQGQLEIAPPTSAQLRYVLLHNAIPFVGFGFLDNCIMIVAGTQIELSIGVVLGISTMAAAALGNLVSDLAGLGLAGYVEALASRLGMQIPELSPKQADMWQTRVSCHTGKAIGVGIGCILGMFPLLFFSDDDEKKEGQTETKDEIPPAPTRSSKN
ncbi:transmembrane protein 65-like isoform X1 [Xiphophorus hellerii]|uniref:transmembrane protein 65-like isoform X1 n=1 Tax=Xiphophorus hellerii TaxID=8084 RepID=UPI0013B43418|nr:transmembrane protein 65-like isoform X1 [Xiphophorus hellerii]XP_032414107.1 transmembrane protein 65-like isoform X1 [Xiphophorus hellerii]XP_032414108.1 transmembrane protein 65-like isoform X1 [Xiphophorus hellerii]